MTAKRIANRIEIARENCTQEECNYKQECKTHKKFNKLVKEGLKNTKEGIWDITRGLTNLILRKDGVGKEKMANGFASVEKGLTYIEKALAHNVNKDLEGFCRIIRGVKDIRIDIKEIKHALHFIHKHRNKSIRAILNGLFTIDESLHDICEGLEICKR